MEIAENQEIWLAQIFGLVKKSVSLFGHAIRSASGKVYSQCESVWGQLKPPMMGYDTINYGNASQRGGGRGELMAPTLIFKELYIGKKMQ